MANLMTIFKIMTIFNYNKNKVHNIKMILNTIFIKISSHIFMEMKVDTYTY